jgi:hypothetical protein
LRLSRPPQLAASNPRRLSASAFFVGVDRDNVTQSSLFERAA